MITQALYNYLRTNVGGVVLGDDPTVRAGRDLPVPGVIIEFVGGSFQFPPYQRYTDLTYRFSCLAKSDDIDAAIEWALTVAEAVSAFGEYTATVAGVIPPNLSVAPVRDASFDFSPLQGGDLLFGLSFTATFRVVIGCD
jgi:hypothetical protein